MKVLMRDFDSHKNKATLMNIVKLLYILFKNTKYLNNINFVLSLLKFKILIFMYNWKH